MTRNQEICALYDAGETLQAIGDRFGITRERVRQIVNRAGRQGRKPEIMAERKRVAEDFRDSGLTVKEFAILWGIPPGTVYGAARQFGVKCPRRHISDDPRFLTAAESVRAGLSIRQAEIKHRLPRDHLAVVCDRLGIQSRAGKWRDFSVRGETVLRLYSQGKTWAAIAYAVSQEEGKPVGERALYIWAHRNLSLPPRGKLRSERKQRPMRPAKPAVVYPDIIIRPTVKETALANRGRAPASKIAKAVGVSRNSIIGYWNRLRQEGVIA